MEIPTVVIPTRRQTFHILLSSPIVSEVIMFRFLLCSFSLVLLYPTAIDLYLVGLPQIAADLHTNESQLHIAFSIYLAGMAAKLRKNAAI